MGQYGWQAVAIGGAVAAGIMVGGVWHYEHAHATCPATRQVVTEDDDGRIGYGCFPAPAESPLRFGYTWFYD